MEMDVFHEHASVFVVMRKGNKVDAKTFVSFKKKKEH